MIVQCCKCSKWFDDEFRNTECDHDTFLANDGQNNFQHYPESWYSSHSPNKTIGWQEDESEHTKYNKFREDNKIAVDKK